MSKHTPGPWTLGKGTVRIRTDDYPRVLIAECYTTQHAIRYPRDVGEREANARLIAAAPQLLWALKAVLACEIRHDENGHAYIHVHARSIFDLPAQIRDIIEQVEGTQ